MSKLRLKRRWFQFSLRTIFIVMTLLALWLGYITHRARQQKQAVEAIEKLGGEVSYDYEPAGPAWLRRLIGIDYFASVTTVELLGREVTDAGLEHLKRLTSLRRLFLSGTQISGAGLEYLKGLTRLVLLEVDDTEVSDIGVSELQQALPNCDIVH